MTTPFQVENPFTSYITLLNTAFYPTPSDGFKTRLIILFVINSSTVILGLIYLSILIFDSYKKKSWGRLWLFRYQIRPSGRYITTNQHLCSGLMAILCSIIIIGHLQDGFKIYFTMAPQTYTAFWRSFSFIPLFIHGWIITFATLQSFLLTSAQFDTHLLSAKLANILFIGGGLIITLALIISASITTYNGHLLWQCFLSIMNELQILEGEWNGKPISFAQGLILSPMLTPLTDLSRNYTVSTFIQTTIMCIVPLLTATVNLASIALARVIRQQIKSNFNFLRQSLSDESCIGQISIQSGFSKVSEISISPSSRKNSEQPSRREMIALAKNVDKCLESEQAKRIIILQRAERTLWIISSLSFIILICASTLIIWVTINLSNGVNTLTSWTSAEIAIFGIEWIYGIIASITLILLISNAYKQSYELESNDSRSTRPIGGSLSQNSSSPTRSFNPTNTMVTFRGMFSNDFIETNDDIEDEKEKTLEEFELPSSQVYNTHRRTLSTVSSNSGNGNGSSRIGPLDIVVEVEVEVEVDQQKELEVEFIDKLRPVTFASLD